MEYVAVTECSCGRVKRTVSDRNGYTQLDEFRGCGSSACTHSAHVTVYIISDSSCTRPTPPAWGFGRRLSLVEREAEQAAIKRLFFGELTERDRRREARQRVRGRARQAQRPGVHQAHPERAFRRRRRW